MPEITHVKLVYTKPYDAINFTGGAQCKWYLDADGYMGTIEAFASAQRTSTPATGGPLPRIGTTYAVENSSSGAETSPYLYCVRLDIERTNQSQADYKENRFEVVGNYSTIEAGAGAINQPGLRPTDPNLETRRWIEFQSETKLATQAYWVGDFDMSQIGIMRGTMGALGTFTAPVSASGKDIDVSIYKDTRFAIYVQELNLTSLGDILKVDQALNETVNNADFTPANSTITYPRHHVKYMGMDTSGQQQVGDGVGGFSTYWTVSLRLGMRHTEPWYEVIPNRAYEYIGESGIWDPDNGVQVNSTEPALLNQDGTIYNTAPTPPGDFGTFLKYLQYNEADYTAYQEWNPPTVP